MKLAALLCASQIIHIYTSNTVLEPRIVGGEPCSDTAPHNSMVLIWNVTGSPHCGGSLISAYWILTAAHCLSRDYSRYVTAGISTDRLDSSREGWEHREVKEFYKHGLYDPPAVGYDIGVIKTDSPIKRSARIDYVKLPPKNRKGENLEDCPKAVAMGWGRTDHFKRGGSNRLMCAILDVKPTTTCVETYGVLKNSICVMTSGKIPAPGDSGGPLLCGGVLEGITSFGAKHNPDQKPVVFTRVDAYTGWLESILKKERSGADSFYCNMNVNNVIILALLNLHPYL